MPGRSSRPPTGSVTVLEPEWPGPATLIIRIARDACHERLGHTLILCLPSLPAPDSTILQAQVCTPSRLNTAAQIASTLLSAALAALVSEYHPAAVALGASLGWLAQKALGRLRRATLLDCRPRPAAPWVPAAVREAHRLILACTRPPCRGRVEAGGVVLEYRVPGRIQSRLLGWRILFQRVGAPRP